MRRDCTFAREWKAATSVRPDNFIAECFGGFTPTKHEISSACQRRNFQVEYVLLVVRGACAAETIGTVLPLINSIYCLSALAFRLVRFVFGEGPGGLGLNFSTSERFSRIFPPIDNVVKRPFPTKRAIAWRVTVRISAASACETHCAGSKVFLGEPLR